MWYLFLREGKVRISQACLGNPSAPANQSAAKVARRLYEKCRKLFKKQYLNMTNFLHTLYYTKDYFGMNLKKQISREMLFATEESSVLSLESPK